MLNTPILITVIILVALIGYMIYYQLKKSKQVEIESKMVNGQQVVQFRQAENKNLWNMITTDTHSIIVAVLILVVLINLIVLICLRVKNKNYNNRYLDQMEDNLIWQHNEGSPPVKLSRYSPGEFKGLREQDTMPTTYSSLIRQQMTAPEESTLM